MLAQSLAVFDIAWGAWSAAWPYLLMVLGFSVIVFVHELGHFAVAKWAGVRVERFAIGFGRELFGFTRGETRYSFNILPLGGYVKMLGQEDFDDKANELRFKSDPASFINKTVGARMAIVSAGVIMNTFFACLLFMIVFLIGMEAEPPRIAFVTPDSPAEKAGLLPGDHIQQINGERMLEFNEVTFAIFLAPPHEPIEFVVERGGEVMPPLYITPEYNPPDSTKQVQRQMVGIGPGVTNEIVAVGPEIDAQRTDHPRVGDRLVEVDGMAVTDDNASIAFHTLAHDRREIFVERKDAKKPDRPPQRVRVEIPPLLSIYPSDPRDPASVSVLGLAPLTKFNQVDPRGRAYLAGLDDGDIILRWDDVPHPSASTVARAVRDSAERDIPFRVQKADGRAYNGFVRPKKNKRGAATIGAVSKALTDRGTPGTAAPDGPQARFADVRPRSEAARAGVSSGDVILRCNSVDHPSAATVNATIQTGAGEAVALSLRKADGRTTNAIVRPQAPGSIDATFNLVADDFLQVGEIVPAIHGRPSPAARASIPLGAKITSVDGTPVQRWRDLISAFQRRAGSTLQLGYTDSNGQAHVAAFDVPHSLHTLLGIGPEAKIVRIDGKETVTVDTPRGSDTLSVLYPEGARTMLTQLVGRTGVTVEYRENPLGELKTAVIDVTDDMVDPWLARVAFRPSIDVGLQTTLLKGKNALDAVWIGVIKTYYFIRMVYRTMQRMIFSRSVSVEAMSGPLGIIDIGGKVARSGAVEFLFFLAMISANLAVLNFLPLPIVDGGLMVFLLIEKIKGSPVSIRVQAATQFIGLVLIVGVFLFVTYQDAVRLWG
jgi:membrane-associated protease RseP (regulator of RpoE activity)